MSIIKVVVNYIKRKRRRFITNRNAQLKQSDVIKINGWVNQYTNLEIINIFKENTFELIETKTWRKQNIYVFKK